MSTLAVDVDANGIATITFDAPAASVNTMTLAWQRDLAAAVERLERDKESIAGVLLVSAKRSFFAGAALRRLLTLKAEDAGASFKELEAMKASLRRLETLGRPVVALLCGSALGGGWEVALAGHARFALDDERIRFGTPEVSLGLIPGASGITKTVRKLGLLAARPYLLEGRLFGPREAVELGWVEGLGSSAADLRLQALAWIAAHADAGQPWDRPDYRLPGGTPDSPKVAAALAVLPAMIAKETRGLYPAPRAILEAMVEGARVDFDTALRIESRKLARIMVGQNAKNMISAFFFDLNEVRSGASPALAGAGAAREHPLALQLVDAYEREGEAMRAEGIPAAIVEHAALAAGMTAGPAPAANETARRGETPALMPAADFEALQRRLLYTQAIEALRCLRAGIVAGRAEANVVSIFGAGFPGWTGGALQFIASEGEDVFFAHAEALAAAYGDQFMVTPQMRSAIPSAAPI